MLHQRIWIKNKMGRMQENVKAVLNWWDELSAPSWSAPFILFLVCVITFGFFIKHVGFYWDDWAKLLTGRLWGLDSYWAYYAGDRPYSAWTHILLTPILGYSPLPWQIFSVLMRFISAWGIWYTFTHLWPDAVRQVTFISLLFVIYPVFDQQAISVTYHQQWMQFALFSFSLAFMIKAQKSEKKYWPFTILSLLMSITQLFITEYFIGVEIIRLPILWIIYGKNEVSLKKRIRLTLTHWFPYLSVLLTYILWRVFFIKLPGSDPNYPVFLFDFIKRPWGVTSALLRMAFEDTTYTLLNVWTKLFDLGTGKYVNYIPLSLIEKWAIGLLVGLIVFIYLKKIKGLEVKDWHAHNAWLHQALLIGLIGFFSGCAQAWITDRHIIDDFHSNRYALPAILGAAILWTVLIEWFIVKGHQKAILVSVVIGLSTIFHLGIIDGYTQVWENQLDFYWQMVWRAPGLKPGTAILSEDELFPNQGLFSISSAFNLLYPQSNIQTPTRNLDFWSYSLNTEFNEPGVANHPLGIALNTQFRTFKFSGRTGDSIMVYYDPQRADCAWILRAEDANEPVLSGVTHKMLPASNLGQILFNPVKSGYPPTDMFGAEKPHTFCYFYQKAELDRQFANWKDMLSQTERADSLYSQDIDSYKTPHEWITFIEGYARSGRWSDAERLTLAAHRVRPRDYLPYLCNTWQRLDQAIPNDPGKEKTVQTVQSQLNCQSLQ